jgi:hypothetical protein
MKVLKGCGVIVLGLIVIGVIAAIVGESGNDDDNGGSTPARVAEEASAPITGRISGVFHRDCLLCDDRMKAYIRTSNVWCGWRGDKVIVHVTMRNDSIEHVTVNWHPSYVIAGGGEHGAGLTAIQSHGFDGGELRQLEAEQDPEGVPEGSPIAECKPSFSTIDSG